LRGIIPCVACETIPAAVLAGFRGAQDGDVILLSPGCASFDQYRNFEERGEDFRQAAHALSGREAENDA
jgi:UDP-N-acetylmuramoylalanine--D-glutamate ligase